MDFIWYIKEKVTGDKKMERRLKVRYEMPKGWKKLYGGRSLRIARGIALRREKSIICKDGKRYFTLMKMG